MSQAQDTKTNPIASHSSNGLLFGGPEDVVRDPRMTAAEKRHILARWASDANAVENLPALRQLDDGSVVSVDEILAALKALDGKEEREAPGRPWQSYDRRRGRLLSRFRIFRRSRDGDDDPPPPPALAAFPVRFIPADAVAA